MSRGVKIGRIAGAPLLLTWSWFVAAAALTFLYFPMIERNARHLSTPVAVAISAGFVLLLFASVLCHEAAHALMARRRGKTVTELALTLWGGHTAYTAGTVKKGDLALIAVVGPLTNLLLAGLFFAAHRGLPGGSVIGLLAFAGFFSNVFVGVFNLLPGLPLDGGQLMEVAVWALTGSRHRGTVTAAWIGRAVAACLLAYTVGLPLLRESTPLTVSVWWSVLIAMFLWGGATEALRAARRGATAATLRAADFLVPAMVVPAGTQVASLPDSLPVIVLGAAGRPVGLVAQAALAQVPAEYRASTPVEAVLVPLPPGAMIDVAAGGEALLHQIASRSGGARYVPLVDRGLIVGILDVAQVAARMR
ncbi:MAG: site-2 protease family protein [Promicromonosporaceae bacterium]|nr:site-2 protease family protein [Promicromonosporaceae bacterium]